MNDNFRWSGYVELNYNEGLKRVEFYYDESAYVYVDGEMADDVESAEDFADSYGRKFYVTLDDFKDNKMLTIEDVWPKK